MIKILKVLAYPLSIMYGTIMLLRNKLFDWGTLSSKTYSIPIIGMGNLSMGGTGKTPHIEYLVRLLADTHKVAILSRGYGRKTKGFLMADKSMSVEQIGDEAVQYMGKFDNVIMAVCESRQKGIEELLKTQPDIQVVLLDDAYQHRYVKPGMNILLTDYSQLYIDNFVVPTGTLREFINGAGRADTIIVSKSPKVLSPIVVKEYLSKIKPKGNQNVFFSYIGFQNFLPLYEDNATEMPDKTYAILMVTGIANPYPLEEYLKQQCIELYKLEYGDHHSFKLKDVEKIANTYKSIYSVNKMIVTTEKDASRLNKPEFRKCFEGLPFFYLPIKVNIHKQYKNTFDQQILNYVNTNQRNRKLHS